MDTSRVYLDHAASTPLAPAVRREMAAVLELSGNPSSAHAEGRAAKMLLEEARSRVADSLACRPREIVFTASGTAAAQLGLRGCALARGDVSRRIVTTGVEHPAVSEAADGLVAEGFEVVCVPPEADGRVPAAAFLDAVGHDAGVAAMMLANHETGALLPVAEVGEELRRRKVPLLTDACLGPGRLSARPVDLHADLVVLSAHKFNGPKGIGLLYVRRRTRVRPLFTGGLQEERLHPGTEDVAGAVGASLALEEASARTGAAAQTLRRLESRFLEGLASLDAWHVVGPTTERLPGLLTIEFPGVEGEAAMINLDLEGIAVSTGSTCALGATDPSPTLIAMGFTDRRAASTLRFSMGLDNTEAEVDRAATAVARVVSRLRALARH